MNVEKKKLIFVHIPKTGGQTMMDILYQVFGFENVLKIWGQQSNGKAGHYSVEDFMNLDDHTIRDYPCIGGHITLDSLKSKLGVKVLRQQYHMYAIVRDPIDTVISLYNYYQTNTDHPRYQENSALSFEEFIAGHYRKNFQCHFLGTTNAYHSIYNAQHFFSKIVTISQFDDLVQEILNEFSVFNTKEVQQRVKNVSNKVVAREKLSMEMIDKIQKDNYQDYLLFEAIKSQEKM